MSSSWDRRIDNTRRRFEVLNEFGADAVLDKRLALYGNAVPAKKPWHGKMPVRRSKAVG